MSVPAVKTDQIILCDLAFYSKENKLNIIGIFDQIFVPNLPTFHSKICIVAFMSGPPDSIHEFTLSINDPAKNSIFSNKISHKNLGPTGRTHILTELINFPLPLEGNYQITVSQSEKILSSTSLFVHKTGISN